MKTPYDNIIGKDIEALKNCNILWWISDNALLSIKGKKVAVILNDSEGSKIKSIWDYEGREIA